MALARPSLPSGPQLPYAHSKLAQQRLSFLPGGRAVVPLLHPEQHGLPFALTLELHASSPAPSSSSSSPSPLVADAVDGGHDGAYTLHYILAGQGQLLQAPEPAAAAVVRALQAGDAVLMPWGGAATTAAAAAAGAAAAAALLERGDGDGGGGDGSASLPGSWGMAELVVYMPQQLFEETLHDQQDGAVPSSLQRFMQQCTAAPGSALGPGPPAGDGDAAAEATACLTEDLVSALLLGAHTTARRALQATPIEKENGRSSNGNIPQAGPSPLLQAAAGNLAAWWVRWLAARRLHEQVLGQAQGQQQQLQGAACPVTLRPLGDLTAFRLPHQDNRLAIQFDPLTPPHVPFLSGIEVFERGHITPPHAHPHAHELFFVLAGSGTAFCDAARMPVAAGDVIAFRPGSVHGIDNGTQSRMYCLAVMLPNEEFAQFIRGGEAVGRLDDDDLCVLASQGC